MPNSLQKSKFLEHNIVQHIHPTMLEKLDAAQHRQRFATHVLQKSYFIIML